MVQGLRSACTRNSANSSAAPDEANQQSRNEAIVALALFEKAWYILNCPFAQTPLFLRWRLCFPEKDYKSI